MKRARAQVLALAVALSSLGATTAGAMPVEWGPVYAKTKESEVGPPVGGLYLLDGKHPRRITYDPADREPDVSRVGLIAFVRGGDVYLVSPDEGRVLRVTSGPEIDERPIFSPDGQSLVFTRRASTGAPRDLFTVDFANGPGPVPVATTPDDESEADFSLDGGLIAFVVRKPGVDTGDIYSARLNGSGLTPLTQTGADERHPLYVSGGISFDRSVPGRPAVYLMRRSGRDVKRLVARKGGATTAAVTPSGRVLVFRSGGSFWAKRLSPPTRGVRRLSGSYGATELAVSIDNRRAAFLLYFDEDHGIAVVDLVGGGFLFTAETYGELEGVSIDPLLGW
ncbi:MAG: TolB family protein [Solirubrobacterales bacterium]